MNAQQHLIGDLEGVLAAKDASGRAEILHRVTDLFVNGSGNFTVDQIDLFDVVMSRLVGTIGQAARAEFGSRLAFVSDAPARVIRTLAFDDAIDVAAPVLAHSVRLEDAVLVENARTKSQGHLLAISGRSILAEAVTDILVKRGNHLVVTGAAANRGARFSASGMSILVRRAQDNGDLALCVWERPDIPRHDLVKLFVQASEIVRGKLEAADPRRAVLVRAAVAQASDAIQATARAGSSQHAQALAYVSEAACAWTARRGAAARVRARGEFRPDRCRAFDPVRPSDRGGRARAGSRRAGTAAGLRQGHRPVMGNRKGHPRAAGRPRRHGEGAAQSMPGELLPAAAENRPERTAILPAVRAGAPKPGPGLLISPAVARRDYFSILLWTCQNRSVRWAVSVVSLP